MRYFKHWSGVIIWAGLIFALSSVPRLESGLAEDFILRKIAHMLEYFVLTWLLYGAFSDHYLQTKKKHPSHWLALSFAFLAAVLYAVSDEYHQTFVFGRSGNLRDVAIDSIGVVSAILFIYKKKIYK